VLILREVYCEDRGVDGTGSGLCLPAGSRTDVEPFGSATRKIARSLLSSGM
jgi:hypothetical protein